MLTLKQSEFLHILVTVPVLGLTRLLRGTPRNASAMTLADLDIPDDVDFEGMAE
jgi:hypothetical protein